MLFVQEINILTVFHMLLWKLFRQFKLDKKIFHLKKTTMTHLIFHSKTQHKEHNCVNEKFLYKNHFLDLFMETNQ